MLCHFSISIQPKLIANHAWASNGSGLNIWTVQSVTFVKIAVVHRDFTNFTAQPNMHLTFLVYNLQRAILSIKSKSQKSTDMSNYLKCKKHYSIKINLLLLLF
jgi:hypothetical protein